MGPAHPDPPGPPAYYVPASRSFEPPPVLFWYRVYCGVLLLMYVACVAGGAALMVFREAAADAETPAWVYLLQGGVLAGIGSVFSALFAASFLLPSRPWAWIFHLVLICIGMTSGCTLPASVALLIFWLKPETRAYFGRP